MKRNLLLAAAGALALGAAGMSAAAAEDITVGVIANLTGQDINTSVQMARGVELAADAINAAGGIDGNQIKLIVEDSEYKAQEALTAATKLYQVDKVPAFITAFSNVVKAVAPIANREKALMLSVGANSPDIKNLGDYVYTTFPLADVDMRALGSWLYTKQNKRKAAVLYVNHETGTEGAKVFTAAFKAAGGEVVLNESYEEQRSDFTGLVLKVRAANPDIVHIHSVISDFTAIVAQMRQLGLNTQVTSFQTAFNPKMIQELGKGAEGIIVTAMAPSAEDNANVPKYLERWQAAHKREPIGLPYTQYFHDAPYIMAALFKHVLDQKQPVTGENMRKALLAISSFDLPLTNQITFNDDHTVNAPTYFWQVKDGKFQVVGKL